MYPQCVCVCVLTRLRREVIGGTVAGRSPALNPPYSASKEWQSFFNVLFCGENPYTQGTRLIKTINRIYRLPATRFARIRGHDVFVSLDLDLSRKHY